MLGAESKGVFEHPDDSKSQGIDRILLFRAVMILVRQSPRGGRGCIQGPIRNRKTARYLYRPRVRCQLREQRKVTFNNRKTEQQKIFREIIEGPKPMTGTATVQGAKRGGKVPLTFFFFFQWLYQ